MNYKGFNNVFTLSHDNSKWIVELHDSEIPFFFVQDPFFNQVACALELLWQCVNNHNTDERYYLHNVCFEEPQWTTSQCITITISSNISLSLFLPNQTVNLFIITVIRGAKSFNCNVKVHTCTFSWFLFLFFYFMWPASKWNIGNLWSPCKKHT